MYKFKVGLVTITLNSSSPSQRAMIEYEGHPSLVAALQSKIERSYTPYGHLIESVASAQDIAHVLKGSAQQIEGDPITFDDMIPEGHIS